MLLLLTALIQPSDACSPGPSTVLATFPAAQGVSDQRIRVVHGEGYYFHNSEADFELLVDGVSVDFELSKQSRVLNLTDEHTVLTIDAVDSFELGARVELLEAGQSLTSFEIVEIEQPSVGEAELELWPEHFLTDNSEREMLSSCDTIQEIDQSIWFHGHPADSLVEIYRFPLALQGLIPAESDLETAEFFQLVWSADALSQGWFSTSADYLDESELCFAGRVVNGSEKGKFGPVNCSMEPDRLVCGTSSFLGCSAMERGDLGWVCLPLVLFGLVRRRSH